MICLGIESTAHTFGIGIFDGRSVLANARNTYISKTLGIVPNEAAKHHKHFAKTILQQALQEASMTIQDIDMVAFSAGPGLPPCLLAGLNFAKTLKKPLIPVNHCIGHIEIGKFDSHCKDPLTIYASGGNTQIISYKSGKYRVFGETLDIGLGNALDKFARNLGLHGGKEIEQRALLGKKYVQLPYSVKGMDLTYSGLVTAALKKQGFLARQKAVGFLPALKKPANNDLIFSFQETAFSMLAEVAERALAHTNKKEVLMAGGVAQNKRLQEMISHMAQPHGAKLFVPKPEYCGDNGAMIALTGNLIGKPGNAEIMPRWRTDDAEISWI